MHAVAGSCGELCRGKGLMLPCAALQARKGTAGERRVDPASLQGVHKKRRDKQERLAAVLAGLLPHLLVSLCFHIKALAFWIDV